MQYICVCKYIYMPSKPYASYRTSVKHEKDNLNKCRNIPSSWEITWVDILLLDMPLGGHEIFKMTLTTEGRWDGVHYSSLRFSEGISHIRIIDSGSASQGRAQESTFKTPLRQLFCTLNWALCLVHTSKVKQTSMINVLNQQSYRMDLTWIYPHSCGPTCSYYVGGRVLSVG